MNTMVIHISMYITVMVGGKMLYPPEDNNNNHVLGKIYIYKKRNLFFSL